MNISSTRSTGLINVEGLISGLNLTDILNKIAQVKRRPISVLQQHQQRLQDTLTVYQKLETRIASLQAAAQSLATSSTFQARIATSADPAIIAVSADPGAALGTYAITVNKLAQAHKISSRSFTAANQALGFQGDILVNGQRIYIKPEDDLLTIASAINSSVPRVQAAVVKVAHGDYRLVLTSLATGQGNAIDLVDSNSSSVLVSLGLVQPSASIKHPISNGAASDALVSSQSPVGSLLNLSAPPSGTIQINGIDVFVDLAADSLQDIASRITALVPGVTAFVQPISNGGALHYELEIAGNSETPSFVDSNNVLVTLGILTKPPANEIQAAQDAQILVDGICLTRSTNSIDDVIPGLRLQLLRETPSASVTVTVQRDLNPAVESVQRFVDAYNSVVDFIRENQSFDSNTGQGGAFMSNYDIIVLETELRRALTYPISGFCSGETLLLSQAGITTDRQDHLVLDQAKLRSALSADPKLFARYFTLTAWSSSTAVTYVGSAPSTRPSGESGYAVSVTQVATRARAESASLPSGIAKDETLTFYDRYTVQLFAGMSLTEAVDSLNRAFAANGLSLNALVQEDRIIIQHQLYGSRYKILIKSSLDRGDGGTDFGGAVAGEVATYAGTDVAGTINSEPATGSGQYLTGSPDNPNTAGLCLKITASSPGDCGVVFLAKGAAQRLLEVISAAENPTTGMFTRATESLNNRISRLREDIDTMEARLEAYLDNLKRKFLALEEALGQAQALSQYIANQLVSIQRLTSGRWS